MRSPRLGPASAAGLPRLVVWSAVLLGLLASIAVAAGTPMPVSAKSEGLTLAGAATYRVQPEHRRVAISVDLTVTNQTSETVTTRYVFDHANLAVLPGTKGFRATNDGTKVGVSVAARSKSSTLVSIRFAKRLSSGRSTRIHLTFVLPDPGGSPSRDVRIGDALATFPVWAFGTHGTPGSSVAVVFPAGYAVRVAVGALGAPRIAANGTVTLSSGRLSDPWAISAYLVAERPGAYVETPLAVRLGEQTVQLSIRAWTDDPGWAKRVGSLLRKGLPALREAIGVDATLLGPVWIEEASARAIGGSPGTYDPETRTIRLDYSAPARVLLLEAAHLWFNGDRFADRWITEGLAGWASARAATALRLPRGRGAPTATPDALGVPLNAWLPGADAGLGAPTDPATAEVSSPTDERAAANALQVVRLVAKRTGVAGFHAVLQAALDGQPAYRAVSSSGGGGSGSHEPVDWRGLLDLVAERGAVDASDIWQTWVVRSTDAPLLAQRAGARGDYARLQRESGDWLVPAVVPESLEAWHFDVASAEIARLESVLSAWSGLARTSESAGLQPPSSVRQDFESGDADAALAEIKIEEAIIEQIAGATEAGSQPRGTLAAVGLLGQDPVGTLAAARDAFARGDLSSAQASAIAAHSTWDGASDLGGLRLRAAGAALLLLSLAVVLASARFRRRSARAATR